MSQGMTEVTNYGKNNLYNTKNKRLELIDKALLGSNLTSWGIGAAGILKNSSKLKNLGIVGIMTSSLGLLATEYLGRNDGIFDSSLDTNDEDEMSFLNKFLENHDTKDIATTVGIGASLGTMLTGALKGNHKITKVGLAGLLVSGIAKIASNLANNDDNYITIMENGTKFQDMLANSDSQIAQEGDVLSVKIGHKVKPKETLWKISQEYETSVNRLLSDSEIKNKNVIEIGQDITVKKYGYRVKDGETLLDVSEKLGIDKNILAQMNRLEDLLTDSEADINDYRLQEDSVLEKNLVLEIPAFNYTIKQGDSLDSIARKMDISKDKLMEINKLSTEELEAGNNILVLYNNTAYDMKTKVLKGSYYRVKEGESLYSLSKKFKVSIASIIKANKMNAKEELHAGTEIIIPAQAKSTKSVSNKKSNVSAKSKKANVEPKKEEKLTKEQEAYISFGKKISNFINELTEEVIVEDIESDGSPEEVGRPFLRTRTIVDKEFQANRHFFEATSFWGPLKNKVVIINAGHGYRAPEDLDSGAIASGVNHEWILNYDNAMRLSDELRDLGADVIFMQGGAGIIQRELLKHPERNKADLFISVHANSSGNVAPAEDRMEVLLSSEVNNASALKSNLFAKSVADKFGERQGVIVLEHGKTNRVGVLNAAEKALKCPAITWEVAFMNQKDGKAKLNSPTTMKKFSKIMSDCIVNYFDNYDDKQFTRAELDEKKRIAKKNLELFRAAQRKAKRSASKRRV